MSKKDKFVLVCTVVQEEYGSHVLKIARNMNISGSTVVKAKGSVQSKFLNMLGLSDARKEICLNVIKEEKESEFYKTLDDHLKFRQPHHGLVFSLPILMVKGLRNHGSINLMERDDKMGIDAIFTIVEQGQSDQVISSAKKAGARGGTVMHGRGSGVHIKEKLFNFEIEPEKEVVLILSPKEDTEKITEALNESFDFDNPGHGVLFVIDVSKTMGLYQKDEK